MRVRLAPGVDPEHAIRVIREIASNMSTAIRAISQHEQDTRNDYVRWAVDAEAQLTSVLRREDARAFFDDPRHRDISSSAGGEHLKVMIYAQLRSEQRQLEETADYVEDRLRRMRLPGLPIVVDSNVLLQCQRLDYVDWLAEVKEDTRVMVPLRVLEEIDAKKYSDSKRLRSISRPLLPWMDALFAGGDAGPVPLREGATIELVLGERPRYRPSDADEEILDVSHDVLQFAGRRKS